MMTSAGIDVHSDDGVMVIRIDRPRRRNALDRAAAQELRRIWIEFESGPERCAVLTATGDKAFCAGVDLDDPPREIWRSFPGLGVPLSKPVIAAVAGFAVGAGFVITQLCDLAVASRTARWRYPGIGHGVFAGAGAVALRRIPPKVAYEAMLLGHELSAERALAVGMVNHIVDDLDPTPVAVEWARQIAAYDAAAVGAMKAVADRMIAREPVDSYFDFCRLLDISATRKMHR